MPVPQLPFTLVQLLGVGSKMKVTNPNTSADGGDDDDSSGAEIDEEEDVDDDNDDELIIEQDKNMDSDGSAKVAALDAAQYAGLCVDFDATVADAHQQNSVK